MIIRYDNSYEQRWDKFVLENSINGSFLQTRNFINYHKAGKFIDHSLIFMNDNDIAAVLPANEIDNGNAVISHQGSTFGGIIIAEKYACITDYKWIMKELNRYIEDNQITRFTLKMPNWLYARDDFHIDLLEYLLYTAGFYDQAEVGFYIDITRLEEGYENYFAKLKKRKLKKAIKENLAFRKLETDNEIVMFYKVLEDNMKKFNTIPIHTCEELLDFKNIRLTDIVSFYGVFYQDDLLAGSMVFDFNNGKVFHTQYLASRQDSLDLCPNEFLYANLIKTAKVKNYRFLSFGTSTLEHGAVLNESLALFKEGFNTETYINRTYTKRII